jgi:cytochrome c5
MTMKLPYPMLLAVMLAPFSAAAAEAPALRSGRVVYESVCIACHASENVMVSAPKLGDAAEWQRRLARSPKGIGTLTDHAVDGFAAMPAKGGQADLTREEIRLAILHMMDKPAR